jgi:hypothetical protein
MSGRAGNTAREAQLGGWNRRDAKDVPGGAYSMYQTVHQSEEPKPHEMKNGP